LVSCKRMTIHYPHASSLTDGLHLL
jgi:hypothetical protein